jgi:hypothetical protein
MASLGERCLSLHDGGRSDVWNIGLLYTTSMACCPRIIYCAKYIFVWVPCCYYTYTVKKRHLNRMFMFYTQI